MKLFKRKAKAEQVPIEPIKRAPQKRGRGALWLVVAVLFASAIIRLASGTGAAIAREISAMTASDESAPTSEPQVCPTDPELAALFEALQSREKRVEESEALLEQKRTRIDEARGELDDKLARLEAAETKLSQTLALADSAAEGDLARLTAVYENMKPKEAATLFEQMDADFAAGFLGRMRPDVAASVMAGLKPEIAYSISVILAGRNANVPKE